MLLVTCHLSPVAEILGRAGNLKIWQYDGSLKVSICSGELRLSASHLASLEPRAVVKVTPQRRWSIYLSCPLFSEEEIVDFCRRVSLRSQRNPWSRRNIPI